MRKIIYFMSMSLDGYIEGPDRDIDWHQVDDDLHRAYNERLAAMGGFLHGRVVHELMADFWPTADQTRPAPGPRPSSPSSGGTCRSTSTPGRSSGPTGTPPSFTMSSRKRSWR